MKIFNLFANKFFTLIIGLFFVIYSVITMVSQSSVMKDNKQLLENYKQNIKQQEQIAKELQREEQMLGTDAYIEQIARERLGLCKSNEKLFVDGKGE